MSTQKITNEELLKVLEERLQSTSELQNRIAELSENLYLVNKKLKETETYKGHFISNITNEIVNPFTSILALSESIQQLSDKEMKKAKKMAELIHNEAFQLDFQLTNIFAAAMIESGKEVVSASAINLKSLCNSLVGFFRKQIEGKHLQVELSFTENTGENLFEKFFIDGPKLELILKNLINNAVKFSHIGGKIEIVVSIETDQLVCQVRDFGNGIPEKERDLIYDRFKQVDERINSINSGHGLGLSIVKSYCQILNGSVDMSFPDDKGTLVAISIPRSAQPGDTEDLSDFIIDVDEKF